MPLVHTLNIHHFPKYTAHERYVTVYLDKTTRTQARNLRCINCGKLVLQVRYPVVMVFDGRVLESQNSVEIDCYNCKTRYLVE